MRFLVLVVLSVLAVSPASALPVSDCFAAVETAVALAEKAGVDLDSVVDAMELEACFAAESSSELSNLRTEQNFGSYVDPNGLSSENCFGSYVDPNGFSDGCQTNGFGSMG